MNAGQAAAGVILHGAPRIDFMTFLEMIGVCQCFFRAEGGDEEKYRVLRTKDSQVGKSRGERGGGAGARLGKARLGSPANVGWGWLGLSADPAEEVFAVRGRHSVQGEEMLAFSHFGGLDAPTS